MTDVTVTICTTCRRAGDEADPRPGTRLHQALQHADLPQGVKVRAAECLSACTRSCSMVLAGGAQRWTYVYGDLDPDLHLEDILSGIRAYKDTTDGLVPWRARPVIFRKQSIARIPPQNDPQE
ncbi:DUF1636 domain-containing protein [Thioclava sp. GXIMD4216]|uniref:DUF1636 domain-containing protein n=1 Tax=Thioclava litoralis TaxID=3076557 RepID=A0ABZ1DXT0_9RHOB|nr:DUF1636 domain-containing protein [Thioclava sp. FTW29]